MNIIGIDLGNNTTNTSTGIEFESTLQAGHINMNKDDIKIEYNGSKWTIGKSEGAKNIGVNKYSKLHFKLCLLTAIAKSVNDNKNSINCKVVIGVPVELHNDEELKESIRNVVMSWGTEKIILNGVEKMITIHDIEVFCESGIVFENQPRFLKEKTLVMDFGGSTLDVSLWEGLTLKKRKTYKEGMITLYENIISAVNQTERVNLKTPVAKDMIGKNTYTISQQQKDITYVNAEIEKYILECSSSINQFFDYDDCNSIQAIGGGSLALKEWITKEFTKAEIKPNAQYLNAITFEKVGKMIWQS